MTSKTWDQLVDEGRRLVAEEGDIKFRLGDLALDVEKHGTIGSATKTLAAFADEVGVTYDQIAKYRQVADAWPLSKRSPSQPWVVHLRFMRRDDRFDLIANPPEHVDRRSGKVIRRWTDTLASRELGAKLPNRTPDQQTPQQRADQIREHLSDPEVAAEVVNDHSSREVIAKALDDRYEQQSPRIARRDVPSEPEKSDPTAVLIAFRKAKRDFQAAIDLVANGRADDLHDVVMAEVAWFRNALDLLETAASAGSIDESLVALLNEEG